MKVVLPIGILLGSLGLAWLVFASKEEMVERSAGATAPLVRTLLAEPVDYHFQVRAQGTVVPRRESELVPQVTGEVVWVSPDLVAGGFFEAGQPLLRIDRADYEVSLESARASVARAESEYARANKERRRQVQLSARSVASEQKIDDAENAFRVAEASLRERRAQLEQAQRELARTELRAPYAGRVRQEQVDVGQFVSRGVAAAKLYAVDYAEVRLPLPDRELAYLDLALARRSRDQAAPADAVAEEALGFSPIAQRPGPPVELSAEFAGRRHTWQGTIVRTEGELDPKSRMIQVVARVENPYGVASGNKPPLAVGLFVEAEIEGTTASGIFVLPRSALRRDRAGKTNRVLVVDAESRLRFRVVDVLRIEREHVIVGGGLQPGERVCVSPLRAVTDGMRVRIAPAPEEGQGLARMIR
jgi:RND family efflux transporter MFP subunit